MAAKLNHFLGDHVDDAAVNAYLAANSWIAEEGWVYRNSTATELRWWDGSAWVGPGGAATDPNAVHVNASAEISAIAPKAAPIAADLLIIEDSAVGNVKKSVQVGNLPSGAPLAAIPPVNVTKAAAVVGVGTTAARDDHKHDATTATAGAVAIGDAAAEGSATSLARSDHAHSLAAPAAPADVTKAARADHKHDVTTATAGAVAIGDVAAEGSATSLARSDHAHSLAAPAAPADVTKAAAAAGASADTARADHKHDVTTAIAGAVTPGDAAAEGSYSTLSRSDHQHSIADFGAAVSTFCEGNDSRLSDSRAPTGAATGDLGGNYPNPTVGDGADSTAIHDDTAGEILAIALKGAPTTSDLLVIEDVAAANAKKRITIGTLPTGLDPNAIHDNVGGEIALIAPKAAPIAADLIIIEDSVAGNAKKSVQIGNLPGGGGGASAGSYVDIGGPYQYTQPAVPVEETMGNGTLDGSLVSTLTAYFRASVTNVWTTTGTTRVRLYDMGPAAGPPGVQRLVTELTATAQGGPREVNQALSVVAAAPGTDDILNTARMYEVVVIQDSSTVGDSAYLSGGLDVR